MMMFVFLPYSERVLSELLGANPVDMKESVKKSLLKPLFSIEKITKLLHSERSVFNLGCAQAKSCYLVILLISMRSNAMVSFAINIFGCA